MKKFISRIMGYVWGPYKEFERNPEKYGGVMKSHTEAKWTTPEHFAHDNYSRGHLPQLCIKASGWKARLLALLFWPEPPYIPNFITWRKNGDHPSDDVWRPFEDTGKPPMEPREGAFVRYFRHPSVDGKSICNQCGQIMNNHGWIDYGDDGKTVCPGTKLYV